VLDVGQGTAIVVQVADKTLVYDTGAAFSDSFDAGSGIVAPYLFSKGVRTVEKLIVSHSDGDHSGGTNGLLRSLEVKDIVTSDPDSSNDWSLGAAACRQQQKQGWQWQDVKFSFLWPPELSANDNNNSCVLLIELMNAERSEPVARVLLPGDIEASAEKLILSRYDLNGLAVVVAPHHGSKTSSSRMFVAETVPDHVVFSAGFNHHFGHPHETVVSRYRPHSQIWSTANSGAIEFEWRDDFSLAVSSHRASRNHYWDTE
jgi:competence protein ComEC